MGLGVGGGGGARNVAGLNSSANSRKKRREKDNAETRSTQRFAEKKQARRDKLAVHKERQCADGGLKVAATRA